MELSGVGAPGEARAWELLSAMPSAEVCRNAAVSFHHDRDAYTVRSFAIDVVVSCRDRSIRSAAPGSDRLLVRLGDFYRVSVLWYLVHAKHIGCTGRMVRPEDVPGGAIFSAGSHRLPLDGVAACYGADKEAFLARGAALGGEPAKGGDAAVRLLPFPRMPVLLALWLTDEEFSARADLLFDSTCVLQLPTDILWSVAMMSVLIMQEPPATSPRE